MGKNNDLFKEIKHYSCSCNKKVRKLKVKFLAKCFCEIKYTQIFSPIGIRIPLMYCRRLPHALNPSSRLQQMDNMSHQKRFLHFDVKTETFQ